MKVSCPQCGTAYRLPPGGLKGGQRLRCRRCSLVFDPPREGEEAARSAAPSRSVEPAGAAPPPVEVAGTARAASREAGWAEPERGPEPPSLADRLEPEADDDPFRDVDLESSPPVPSDEPRGTSAIRAQSGHGGERGPAPDPDEAGGPAELTGWLARTDDGMVRPFRDLDALRAWMDAHPGVRVQVSGDGERWRAPETLLARDVPVARPAATPTPSLQTGTTTALRAGARRRAPLDGAGLAWGLAAAGSTLLLLGVLALNVQRLGLADLSPWVPFEALGFADLVPVERETDGPAAPARDGYAAAARAAERAQAEGRLVEAAVAWRRALAVREDPAALAALAEVYERLGEGERARAARSRLSAIRPAEE